MDHQITVFLGQRDDLEQRAIARWPEVKAEVVVELIDRHCVANGVLDVLDGHAVPERRRMDIHTKQSYYETWECHR